MNLEEVQFKLLAEVQSLPSELALEFVRSALNEIYRERDWSFLYKQDILRTPRLISTGTVAVTQYSESVIVSSEVAAIIEALAVEDVKIEGRQFRTFGGTIAGSNFIYTIIAYDSDTNTLTLDQPYWDETNSAISYQIFKNLYTAQEIDIDFAHFEFIASPFDRRRIGLDLSRAQLDFLDSSRIAMGDPHHAIGYIQDSSGNQLIELYPIPINNRIYRTYYKRQGITLEPEDNIPAQLPYELVIAKAKIKAYEWLAGNSDKVGEGKKNPNLYLNLIGLAKINAMELYDKIRIADDNLLPQMLIEMGSNYPYYENVVTETILLDF